MFKTLTVSMGIDWGCIKPMKRAAQPKQRAAQFQLAGRHGLGGAGQVSIARNIILG